MKDSIKRWLIYAYLLVAMALWGMSFIWTSIVFKYYDPISTIFIRLLISGAFIFIILLLTGKIQRIARKDIGLFLLSAVFNPFFYFLGENFGLKYSTPTISAVIIATIPLFSPVIAVLTVKEKISWFNVLGIFISFFGILIMLINPDLSLSASVKGVSFLMFAVLSAVAYSVLLKILSERYSPIMIIGTQNVIGTVYFLPLFLLFGWKQFADITPNFELISSLFFLAILCSSIAFILLTKGIKEIGISRTNVFSNAIPVFTAIFSFFILSENFSTHKIIGIVVVLTGILFTQRTGLNKIIKDET